MNRDDFSKLSLLISIFAIFISLTSLFISEKPNFNQLDFCCNCQLYR